jgi:uncharacterized repeat protein (TIGR01451 family)
LLAFALLGANEAGAQAITRYARDTGHINFVTTGGSLRNSPNTGSPCNVSSTSTQTLSGIPATRTIRKAYLYWGASGTNPDTSVTLNGSTVTASRTFTRTFDNGTEFDFYGGFADVTSRVTGNGSYTFGGLNVSTGSPWCNSQAVVGGWALIVIYEGAAERLRAINLYDGLDYFYGSQVIQTPDGFRVPPSNIDGRIAVFTLDGDPQNSDPSAGGVSESLRFNGTALDDGLVPSGSDPTFQQFDGTINTQGVVTSYGIDVDQYDVSALLSPGQTSATTIYSSGADLVLLMAQIVSATSDPAVNLAVTTSHAGNFTAGTTGTFTVNVSNLAGMEREENTVTVTDVLPAGLGYSSFTGTGWSCGAAGQTVTCTHAPTLNAGAAFPALNITVNVSGPAVPSVANTVAISTASFDIDTDNNTATDNITVLGSDLSTSTKSVVDINGGDANPGDTLRYTITLRESAGRAAAGVSLTDSVPANTTWSGVVSLPAGASSTFAPAPAGTDGNGELTVSNIPIAANGSATVVFDVTVANVSPSAQIDNTASISNPNGSGATPSAPTVIVSASRIPGSGTKQLYLWSNPQRLSRTRPTGNHNAIDLDEGDSTTFTLNPALQTALTLKPGNFTVYLLMQRTSSNSTARTVRVRLSNSATGTIDTEDLSFTQFFSSLQMYSVVLDTGGIQVPAGSTFSLQVSNLTSGSGQRSIDLVPYDGGNYSRVELDSATIINVDSVQTWTAAWNGGAQQGTWNPGNTLFVRAQISDPFGSFDISSATISLVDPDGNTVVNDAGMTGQGSAAGCGSTGSATCIYQYQYAVPASPTFGAWTIRVTGNEGVEGVTDVGVGSFIVAPFMPQLTVLKTSAVLSDPTGAANPKRIPGAVVRYDIGITNGGPGVVDANSLEIVDPIPANAAMYVAGGAPVVFINGSPVSGLMFNYAANVKYSSSGVGGPFDYTPSPDADGYDPLVRAVRILPGGVMNAAAGGNNPSFTVQFRIRIN